MKKILITGASGMVGRNLVEFLNMKNYTLLTPSSKELNLLNKNQIDLYLSNNKPDIVIHCAGKVGGIQANMASPVSFLVDNMQMGLNIIMASFEKEIKNFINLSSSCMYPKNALNPLSEELILKGELEPTNEGYALAKVTTTRLCEYINQEDNSYQYKTIIPCNLYGKEESFRFVLPGYNVRPVEMSGAIGIEQLKKLLNFLKIRRENAELFVELFSDHPDYIIQKDICNSSWFGFSLIIKPTSNLKRADVVKKLMEAKIDCRPIVTGNFTKNDVMKYFDYEIHGELKNADYLHENGLFVGNSQVCLKEEIRYLKEVLK